MREAAVPHVLRHPLQVVLCRFPYIVVLVEELSSSIARSADERQVVAVFAQGVSALSCSVTGLP